MFELQYSKLVIRISKEEKEKGKQWLSACNGNYTEDNKRE